MRSLGMRIGFLAMATLVSCGGGQRQGIDAGMDALPDPTGLPDLAEEIGEEPDSMPVPDSGPDLPLVPEASDPGPEGPTPGGLGWPCATDSECLSAACIETPDSRICTIGCDGDVCPEGLTCRTDRDGKGLCLHAAARRCLPCARDDDCASPHATAALICADLSDRSVCLRPCETGADCDPGETCSIPEAGVGFCRPDNGICACGGLDGVIQAAGTCKASNVFGTCVGTFTCQTACDAPVPTAETCNAIDDDCDGVTDNHLPEPPCFNTNLHGSCKGYTGCEDGKTFCDAPVPAAEVCNGLDDDCDGQIDDGFADSDGDGQADCMDEDDDGDGVPDLEDDCPGDADPGQEDLDADGIGDVCDPDADGDGIPNSLDVCPRVADPAQEDCDSDGKGDHCTDDDDDDGVPDTLDNCLCGVNPLQEDADGDGDGNLCDPDADGDGLDNDIDNCPLSPNPGQEDLDSDGHGDACDPDADGDNVADAFDNCPGLFNPDQADLDRDGQGDSCDPDDDGDGVPDDTDNCPDKANPGQEDLNETGIGDACEPDWDGDGVLNEDDDCAWVFDPDQADLDNDHVGDACDCDIDGDGVANLGPDCPPPLFLDTCPTVPNPDQGDLDGDGLGNACDPDRDGDGDPNETDCGPDDPTVSRLLPETCNGQDDDCDGLTDETGAIGCFWFHRDADRDTWGTDEVRCECGPTGAYSSWKSGDCDDADPKVNPAATEVCNGSDDDCDGETDEADAQGCQLFWVDADGDGFGMLPEAGRCLCGPEGGFVATKHGDCDDSDAEANPEATEVCNGRDDDCDGETDEAESAGCRPYWTDADGDSYGTGVPRCLCGPDPAHGLTALRLGDCDDTNADVRPDAAEICDGMDDDCDGQPDEGLGATTCGIGECRHTVANCAAGKVQVCDPELGKSEETCDGKDNDCDGETDENLGSTTCGIGECVQTIVNCVDGVPRFCTPLPPGIETCNLRDDDCDGLTDEELGTTTCGIGGCRVTLQNCVDGEERPCVPGLPADEICNGRDDDCDGLTDEELGFRTCGKGECAVTIAVCQDGVPRTCEPKPPGQETCDGRDNDCDGLTDEDLGTESCGEGECASTVPVCVDGQVQVCVPGPAFPEVCDAKDNDCNGLVDDDCEGLSCRSIHEANPALPTGTYRIAKTPGGTGTSQAVFCDMESAGGGWTLIAFVDDSDLSADRWAVLHRCDAAGLSLTSCSATDFSASFRTRFNEDLIAGAGELAFSVQGDAGPRIDSGVPLTAWTWSWRCLRPEGLVPTWIADLETDRGSLTANALLLSCDLVTQPQDSHFPAQFTQFLWYGRTGPRFGFMTAEDADETRPDFSPDWTDCQETPLLALFDSDVFGGVEGMARATRRSCDPVSPGCAAVHGCRFDPQTLYAFDSLEHPPVEAAVWVR